MRGHLREIQKGKWFVRPSCGVDPVTGRRLQPSKVVFGTRQDAERAMLELWLEHRAQRPREGPNDSAQRFILNGYLNTHR